MAIINTWVEALIHKDKYNPTPKKKEKDKMFYCGKGVGDLINSWIYMHQVLSLLWIKNKRKKSNVFKPGFETRNPKQ